MAHHPVRRVRAVAAGGNAALFSDLSAAAHVAVPFSPSDAGGDLPASGAGDGPLRWWHRVLRLALRPGRARRRNSHDSGDDRRRHLWRHRAGGRILSGNDRRARQQLFHDAHAAAAAPGAMDTLGGPDRHGSRRLYAVPGPVSERTVRSGSAQPPHVRGQPAVHARLRRGNRPLQADADRRSAEPRHVVLRRQPAGDGRLQRRHRHRRACGDVPRTAHRPERRPGRRAGGCGRAADQLGARAAAAHGRPAVLPREISTRQGAAAHECFGGTRRRSGNTRRAHAGLLPRPARRRPRRVVSSRCNPRRAATDGQRRNRRRSARY
jgi:hypothetical protein